MKTISSPQHLGALRVSLLLALVTSSLACSSEKADPDPADAAAIDGASGVDSAITGGPPAPGQLGGECCVTDNCDKVLACDYPMGACHEDSWGTPDGMCTVWCDGPGDPVCPEGSQCGCSAGGGQCACIYLCADDADCRVDDGYRCCADQGCMPVGWEC